MIRKDFLRFEVLTPLMVGGQTRRKTCNETISNRHYHHKDVRKSNLNINSIKGQLRWWFRTIHGHSANLSQWERELFGSTDGASKVKLSLKNQNTTVNEWPRNFNVKSFGEYKFSAKKPGQYDGLKYFSYTNRVPTPDDNHPENNLLTVREYLRPGGSFDVQFVSDDRARIKLLALFWFASQFSGFGNRSRRCFGNVKILNPKQLNYDDGSSFTTFSSYRSQEQYVSTIRQNFQTLKDKIFANAFAGNNSIPALSENARLFLSDPVDEPGWQEAINYAGATMQRFRAVDDFEHHRLEKFDPSPATLRRPIFGLPILMRYTSTHTRLTINYKTDEGLTRLASPILVSLTQIANRFHVQYLILAYDLNADKIIAQYGRNSRRVRLVADAKQKFIDHLASGFQFRGNPKVYKYNEINLWS